MHPCRLWVRAPFFVSVGKIGGGYGEISSRFVICARVPKDPARAPEVDVESGPPPRARARGSWARVPGQRAVSLARLAHLGHYGLLLDSFRPLWAAGATAARWETLGFLGPLWPLQGGGFGVSCVRIRARSTYTNTST